MEAATADESGYIEMEKKTGAEGFFDDGLTYLFQQKNEESGELELAAVRPTHIHFEVQTTPDSAEMETCDFRFYSVEKKVTEAERRRLEEDSGNAGEPGENEG